MPREHFEWVPPQQLDLSDKQYHTILKRQWDSFERLCNTVKDKDDLKKWRHRRRVIGKMLDEHELKMARKK